MTTVGAADWLRAQGQVYRRLEDGAHYNWRHGILVASALAVALTAGRLLPGPHAAMIAALAAWFIALAVSPPTVPQRFVALGRRLLILTAATGLGVLAAPSLAWTIASIAALCLAIPLPAMTITPVICFLMGLDTPAGMTPLEHVSAFAAGGAAAVAVLLLPWAATPGPASTGSTGAHHARHGRDEPRADRCLWADVISGGPRWRYASQASVAVVAAYVALHTLHWPHAGWVLVGILTTLRPTWTATHARLVKRSLGMIGGSLLTAGLFTVTAHLPACATVTLISALGGAARPLRQYNYGLWPVLGTPVLLLLVNLTTPLTPTDAAWRLANNLLGALITLTTITTLWPHPTQRPTRGH